MVDLMTGLWQSPERENPQTIAVRGFSELVESGLAAGTNSRKSIAPSNILVKSKFRVFSKILPIPARRAVSLCGFVIPARQESDSVSYNEHVGRALGPAQKPVYVDASQGCHRVRQPLGMTTAQRLFRTALQHAEGYCMFLSTIGH